MNKIAAVFIFLLLLCSNDVFSQEIGNSTNKYEGSVYYKNQKYDNCKVVFEKQTDEIVLVIKSESDEPGNSLFQVYLTLPAAGSVIPQGLFTASSSDARITNTISSSMFVWVFKDWEDIYHLFETKESKVYIQQFPDGTYLISGAMELDTQEKEVVEFRYCGVVEELRNEVISLSSINPADLMDNKGELYINNVPYSLPYAYLSDVGNKKRVCISDKIPVVQKDLEYGFFFEFDLEKDIPMGTFVVDDSSKYRVGFFNQDKIEYPTDAEISIKYNNKKNIYTLTYAFTTSDNQKVKGTYTGKIPTKNSFSN